MTKFMLKAKTDSSKIKTIASCHCCDLHRLPGNLVKCTQTGFSDAV